MYFCIYHIINYVKKFKNSISFSAFHTANVKKDNFSGEIIINIFIDERILKVVTYYS